MFRIATDCIAKPKHCCAQTDYCNQAFYRQHSSLSPLCISHIQTSFQGVLGITFQQRQPPTVMVLPNQQYNIIFIPPQGIKAKLTLVFSTAGVLL